MPRLVALAQLILVLVASLASLASPAHADDREDALRKRFAAMEKALRGADETLFQAQWHPDGYASNLVGGSGNTGARMYQQGARKKWFPRPDFAKLTLVGTLGLAVIVPCAIWSWDKDAAVDAVDVLLVRADDKSPYVVLGAGEDHGQVKELAKRWNKKEPLAPPSKP